MALPPHLPKKSTPLMSWDRVRLWVWFGLGVVSAFVSCIAGTLSTIAWFAPAEVSTPTIFTFRRERSSFVTTAHIDPLVLQQVQQRIVRVYDRRQKIDGIYYTNESKLGEAILLTREGWAVLTLPNLAIGEEKNLEIVDFQGNIFPVTSSMFDPINRLAYIKIDGTGFRGDTVFADWQHIDVDTAILSIDGTLIQEGYIEGMVGKTGESFPIWQNVRDYILSSKLTLGSLVITEKGEFVGFVGENHTLIPSWFVSTHLRSVFVTEKIVYESLPLRGQEFLALSTNGRFEERGGFIVK